MDELEATVAKMERERRLLMEENKRLKSSTVELVQENKKLRSMMGVESGSGSESAALFADPLQKGRARFFFLNFLISFLLTNKSESSKMKVRRIIQKNLHLRQRATVRPPIPRKCWKEPAFLTDFHQRPP